MWSNLLTEEQIASLVNGFATPLSVLGNPARPRLEISHDSITGQLRLSWESQQGKFYTVRSEIEPGSSEPLAWPIFDGQQDLQPTPPKNTLSLPLPAAARRFFAIEEHDAR